MLETDIKIPRAQPAELAMVERATNGNFYGYITSVKEDGQEPTTDLHPTCSGCWPGSHQAKPTTCKGGHQLNINYQLERLRLKSTKAEAG